jgi:dynein heavy chain
VAGGEGESPEDVCDKLATDMLAKFPDDFDMAEIIEKFPVTYEESMNTVLRQELIRYNRLTSVIRSSLVNLKKAIKGLVVMNDELDELFQSMMVGRQPILWSSKSYPSLKPMASYVSDLLARLAFFQSWIDNGTPQVFWLSGFYFTQSFLSGAMQNYARKYTVPIDHVGFEFEVLKVDSHEITEKPSDGCYVYGLFMEGARWDIQTGSVAESKLKELTPAMPVVLIKAIPVDRRETKNVYECPVYKTKDRGPTYVWNFFLKTKERASKWTLGGVALILQP